MDINKFLSVVYGDRYILSEPDKITVHFTQENIVINSRSLNKEDLINKLHKLGKSQEIELIKAFNAAEITLQIEDLAENKTIIGGV